MKIERNQISHESAAEGNDWSIDVFQSTNWSGPIFPSPANIQLLFAKPASVLPTSINAMLKLKLSEK